MTCRPPDTRVDEGLRESLRLVGPHGARLSSEQVQALAREYDEARLALWRRLLAGPRGRIFAAELRRGCPSGQFARGSRSRAAICEAGRAADVGLRLAGGLAGNRAERAALVRARAIRERLALANLGLAAAFVARHRGGPGLELTARGDDALQEALAELLVAIDRFDPRRGVRLSTYVAHYLRLGVQRARYSTRPVGLNRDALGRWAEAEAAEQALAQQLGREPSEAEVAARLGSARKLETARAVARALRPSDELELDVADPDLDPEAALIAREEAERLRATIDRALPPGSRERVAAEVLAEGGRLADVERAIGRRHTSARLAKRVAREALQAELEATPSARA
ncbi:MAG TPA: sigma factor [Nannocystis sp.]